MTEYPGARKVEEMDRVHRTLGDLVSRTEGELLACKNFGQSSLNEVRQRVAEFSTSRRIQPLC